MANELRAGVYRHYKGGVYLILGLARHSETEEKLVVYVPLGAKAGPRLTVRPLAMFLEQVEIDGVKKPRFEYVDAEMPTELAKQYRYTTDWGQPT